MKSESTNPEIVTRNGKPVSVILPIEEYEELLERAEDAEDVAWLKKAHSKPQSYRTLEDCITQSDLI
ncbi:MAG: prevent-host-death family protein [Limisphaerales bacterium]|jgi:prevent-host-death family protein